MKKRLIPIYAVLVVAIVLLAVFVPSCGPTTGTIEVKATLCGNPWPTQGTVAMNYTLTPGTGSPINGNNVSATFSVDPGTWTCGNVSGGPAGAHLDSIKPSATQTVSKGGNITFTLDFELDQDAAIEWLTWTVNGEPFVGSELQGGAVCNIIDAHFKQWVNGCEEYQVAVNETSVLLITQTQGPVATVYAVNDLCAVNKTPTQGLPPVKKSQVVSINGEPLEPGDSWVLMFNIVTPLDVETAWQLVKETDYTKSINWFGISLGGPQEPGHECVLFELVLPMPHAQYKFTLQTSAMVALVDDTDVNTENNDSGWSPALFLTVNVP